MTPTGTRPKVSIKTITYNQERFISQAIDGLLMQEVDFDYEMVIGEDCSTDNTREIVIDYQKRYPDKIRLILNEKNMGGYYNFIQTLYACRGQYVAILDGDDYWTSPHKLQKQVNFMEEHPECSMCYHNVEMVYDDGRAPALYIGKEKPFLSMADIVYMCHIPSCSVVYRNRLFDKYPDSFSAIPFCDWPLYVLNAEHGLIGYIDEVMGAWRFHAGGAWTQGGHPTNDHLIKKGLAMMKFYETINSYLAYRYDRIISERIAALKKRLGELTKNKEQ